MYLSEALNIFFSIMENKKFSKIINRYPTEKISNVKQCKKMQNSSSKIGFSGS